MKKGESKNENKKKLTILIDEDLIKELKVTAINEDISVGDLIEKLYIEKYKSKE